MGNSSLSLGIGVTRHLLDGQKPKEKMSIICWKEDFTPLISPTEQHFFKLQEGKKVHSKSFLLHKLSAQKAQLLHPFCHTNCLHRKHRYCTPSVVHTVCTESTSTAPLLSYKLSAQKAQVLHPFCCTNCLHRKHWYCTPSVVQTACTESTGTVPLLFWSAYGQIMKRYAHRPIWITTHFTCWPTVPFCLASCIVVVFSCFKQQAGHKDGLATRKTSAHLDLTGRLERNLYDSLWKCQRHTVHRDM